MTFRIIYNQEYKRTMPAILIDSRSNVAAISSAGGFEVKAYNDSQIDSVTYNIIPYKIESDNGNLVGYFNLSVSINPVSATVLNKQIRPAFIQFNSELSLEISNFIISNNWQQDYLF